MNPDIVKYLEDIKLSVGYRKLCSRHFNILWI